MKNIRSAKEIETQIKSSMGEIPPDLVLKGGQIVNTLTGEIYEGDIAIKDNRIVRTGDISDIYAKFNDLKTINCTDSYLLPGLIDSHLHTESTLMTPTNFTKVALPLGTTTAVVDPHEVGNVLGIPGLEIYIDEVKDLPLEFLVEIPSCVPAAPTLETGPNIITADEYIPLLESDNFFALAEMMNFPGVIYTDEEVIKKLAYAEQYGKVREGHAPGLMGKEIQAYITSGVSSCHETFTVDEVIGKLRGGMKIQLREGSFARNLLHLANGIKDRLSHATNVWDQVIICSDDKHADDLIDEGHLDFSLRLLVNEVGLDPVTAIRICSLNPANHLQRSDLGAIAPGKMANILRVNNLSDFEPLDVISRGKHVGHNKELIISLPTRQYPNWALDTVRPKYIPSVDDLVVYGPQSMEEGSVNAHIIGVINHSLVTDHLVESVKIENNRVVLEENRDLAYYFLLDRHAKTNNFSKSLVTGFNFKGEVAVASTVSHDSHQLLLTGNSPECMAEALKDLIRVKGGQTIVTKKNRSFEKQILPLPYAGLMSTQNPKDIAATMKKMKDFSKEVCLGVSEPFMSLSFMALPVIPKLKLTDKGLVDVDQFKIIELFEA
ncbi:MAG: adenine deaminase [Candidatus Heimdallarchaeota archaeon]|nr:adenine deaminase [Candidatus Heimdallarchaeota archaeon]